MQSSSVLSNNSQLSNSAQLSNGSPDLIQTPIQVDATQQVAAQSFNTPPAKDSSKKESKLKGRLSRLEYLSLGCTLVSSVRYVGNACKNILGIKGSEPVLGSLKCVSCVSVPIAIFHIAQNLISTVKGTINEKVDALLEITYGVGSLGDAAATFASGLESAGLVTAKAIMWTTPLFIVSMGLELAGVALNIKSMAENIIFSSQLSKHARLDKSVEEYSSGDYQKGLDYLVRKRVREKSVLRKHFKVQDKKLLNRLLDVEIEANEKMKSANVEVVKEGKGLLKNTMSALKGRITARLISTSVVLLAATITLIGSALLFTPAQPLGFALLALGVGIGFAKLGLDYELTRRFENKLELNGKGVHRRFLPIPSSAINWIKKRKGIKVIEPSADAFKQAHFLDDRKPMSSAVSAAAA